MKLRKHLPVQQDPDQMRAVGHRGPRPHPEPTLWRPPTALDQQQLDHEPETAAQAIALLDALSLAAGCGTGAPVVGPGTRM
jgi:hypothetical protein